VAAASFLALLLVSCGGSDDAAEGESCTVGPSLALSLEIAPGVCSRVGKSFCDGSKTQAVSSLAITRRDLVDILKDPWREALGGSYVNLDGHPSTTVRIEGDELVICATGVDPDPDPILGTQDRRDSGFVSLTPRTATDVFAETFVTTFAVRLWPTICGNGFVGVAETCDDANTVGGDGCSATCQREVAPTITLPPADVAVDEGATAMFAVVAAGTPPLQYQWKRNGTNLTGATAASYTTPPTSAADDGALFSVAVTNATGTITSAAARLSVRVLPRAPSITRQPQSLAVAERIAAQFSVVASGTGLTYQWLRNGAPIGGATNASYTTPPATLADNGAQFSVRVASGSFDVTSTVATLDVLSTGDGASVCSGSGGTGWCWAYPAEHGIALRAIRFNGSTGIAVGPRGMILRSTDGGLTWQPVTSGSVRTLVDVAFADAGNAVAISDAVNGTPVLLHSADGGQSWTNRNGQIDFGTALGSVDNALTSVSFGGAGKGLVVGGNGTVIRTGNGGATWSSRTPSANSVPPQQTPLTAVGHLTADAAVTGASNGLLYKTENAGTGWLALTRLGGDAITSIAFAADGGGVMARNLRLARSLPADLGTTWNAPVTLTPFSTGFMRVRFEQGVGYAVGTPAAFAAEHLLYRSTDNGITWTATTAIGATDLANNRELRDLALSGQRGVAVDNGFGGFVTTTDGGLTWRKPDRTGDQGGQGLTDVGFAPDGALGLAVGGNRNLLRSTNGGASWSAVEYDPNGVFVINSVALPGAAIAVAGTDQGSLLRSSDGGLTWSAVAGTIGTQGSAFAFADASVGVVVSAGGILRTTDSGQTWTAVSAVPATRASFGSADVGAAGGPQSGGVLITADKGATWQLAAGSPIPSDVQMIGDQTVFVASGAQVLRSTDRGQTFTPLAALPGASASTTVVSVRFATLLVGSAVLGDGTLLQTVDGGASWTRVPMLVQGSGLRRVVALSANVIVGVGRGENRHAIVRTVTAGQ
jgi:cysteine-rich repeat protein